MPSNWIPSPSQKVILCGSECTSLAGARTTRLTCRALVPADRNPTPGNQNPAMSQTRATPTNRK
ncbi:hypothetical protein HaLaN_04220 [Haematococcus lacustris]|uniref:Uncharacterized protein n=1 Tax=Haematococcus lacustris TaxID=44745 RepID=A0A699YG24_HAELA|nr:hypothetical protein HaLaN_04220 [Haematococcus lacustris]